MSHYDSHSMHTCHPEPPCPAPYPIHRRGPRGPQGLPGVAATNDNAIVYYLTAGGDNSQTIALGNTTNTLLLNQHNINGTLITRTGNTINLPSGTYFVELSTYALVPTLGADETLTFNVFLNHGGIPTNATPESIPVYSPVAQHIYIPTIIETQGTTLTANATITSDITSAITSVTFINTVINIIRLGNFTA